MADPRSIPDDSTTDDDEVIDLVTEEAVEHGWVSPEGSPSGADLHEAERRRGDHKFDEAYQHATTADLAP